MNTVYMNNLVLCYSDYSDRLHYLQCMHMKNYKKENTASNDRVSVGAKLRYMGYFASLLHPQVEKVGYYFQSGTCLRALESLVLLSFLWLIFYKWPVINVTPTNIENSSTQTTSLIIYFTVVSMNVFEV